MALIVLWVETYGNLKCEIANDFYILHPKRNYVQISHFLLCSILSESLQAWKSTMLLVLYLQFKVKIDSTALYLSEHFHPLVLHLKNFILLFSSHEQDGKKTGKHFLHWPDELWMPDIPTHPSIRQPSPLHSLQPTCLSPTDLQKITSYIFLHIMNCFLL